MAQFRPPESARLPASCGFWSKSGQPEAGCCALCLVCLPSPVVTDLAPDTRGNQIVQVVQPPRRDNVMNVRPYTALPLSKIRNRASATPALEPISLIHGHFTVSFPVSGQSHNPPYFSISSYSSFSGVISMSFLPASSPISRPRSADIRSGGRA